MLTLTLRELERDGLVTRTVYPTIPPRVEYQLTKLGRTLREPLIAVADWVRKYQPAMVEARKKFCAVRSSAHASRGALEQSHAKVLLETLHQVTHGRLR